MCDLENERKEDIPDKRNSGRKGRNDKKTWVIP